MCDSPGSGGHRAQVRPDRCQRAGGDSRGRLHVQNLTESGVPIIDARVIVISVSAGVECDRSLKQPGGGEFVGGNDDDGPVAV
jgi:hypothetical protein